MIETQKHNVIFSELIKRLDHTLVKFNSVKLGEKLFLAGISVIVLLNLSVLVEFFANGGKDFRSFLFFSSLAVSFVLFIGLSFKEILAFLKIKYSLTVFDIATLVGQKYESIKDRLLNSLDLFGKLMADLNNNSQKNIYGISPELVLADLDKTNTDTKNIDFNSIIDYSKIKKIIPVWLTLLLCTIGLNLIPNYHQALIRVLNYDKAYVPAIPFELYNDNQPEIFVDKGNSVKLEFRASGKAPNYINVLVETFQEDDNNSGNVSNKAEKPQVFKVKLINKNIYKFELSNIKEKYKVYAQTSWYDETVSTTKTTVLLSQVPEITGLNGVVRYPSYTKEKEDKLSINNADIIALKGSQVNLVVTTNNPIVKANLIFELNKSGQNKNNVKQESGEAESEEKVDTTKLVTVKTMEVTDKKAKIGFVVSQSGNYWVEVENAKKEKNLYPVKYSIVATQDDFPRVTLLQPETDLQVKDKLLIPIISQISDDYGFHSFKLFYRLIHSKYRENLPTKWLSLDIPIAKDELEQTVEYVWDLESLHLSPEDVYEYYLQVADNDVFAGYKEHKTNSFTIRMVSFEESLKLAENSTNSIKEKIETAKKKSEEVNKEMQELRKDLLSKKDQSNLSWEQQKKAEAIAKKQNEVENLLQQAQKEMEQATKQMQDNNVISEETLQKYVELQKLIKEVNSEEIRKMSETIDNMAKQLSPEEMRKAIEQANFNEEVLRQSIERTKKYLEKLKFEQKADAVQKLAENLAKRQDELMKKNDSQKENNQDLAKQQDNLKQDLANLEEQMKDLEKQSEQADNLPPESFKEAQQEFKPDELKQDMQEAKSSLQKNDNNSAKKSQSSAKKKLNNLAQKMNKLKQELQNKMAKEIERQFNKSINDIIQLSKAQEELNKKMQQMNPNSTRVNEGIKEQGNITNAMRNALENISKLAEQTVAIKNNTIEDILSAIQQMQQVQSGLQDRMIQPSLSKQKSAMAAMNSAAKSLQSSLKDMKQGGDGSCDNPGGSGEGGASGSGGSPMSSGSKAQQQMQQMLAQQKMIQEAMQKMQQGNSQGGESQGSSGGTKQPSQMTSQERAEYGRLQGEQGKALKSMEELAKEQEKYKSKDPVKSAQMKKAIDEMKEVMSDIKSGRIDNNTFKKQERILSRMLDLSRSENERDRETKREATEAKDVFKRAEGQAPTDEEKKRYIQELLKTLKFSYSTEYEKIISTYLNSLKQNF